MNPSVALTTLLGFLNRFLAIPERGRPNFERLTLRGDNLTDWTIRAVAVHLLSMLEQDVASEGRMMPAGWWNPLRVVTIRQQLSGDETHLSMQVVVELPRGRLQLTAAATARPVVAGGPASLAVVNVYVNGRLARSESGKILTDGTITQPANARPAGAGASSAATNARP